jgi:hypothetical protein
MVTAVISPTGETPTRRRTLPLRRQARSASGYSGGPGQRTAGGTASASAAAAPSEKTRKAKARSDQPALQAVMRASCATLRSCSRTKGLLRSQT